MELKYWGINCDAVLLCCCDAVMQYWSNGVVE
jgi:hypothetical protein